MIEVELDRLEILHEFRIERATDLGEEGAVTWSFESEKVHSQGYGVRDSTARSARRRMSLPPLLEQLLACKHEQIPELGMRVLQSLGDSRITKICQNRTLERLVSRLTEACKGDSKDGKEQNYIAAFEILVTLQSPSSLTLLDSWLGSRPVTEGFLYLAAIPRSLGLAGTPRLDRFSDLIIQAFDDVVGHGQLDTEWGKRLGVEVFRTLATINPVKAVGPVCRHLAVVGSLEMSAMLEAVLQALRAAHISPSVDLTNAAEKLWRRYLSTEGEGTDNVAGVLARLLEILSRSGQPMDEKLNTLLAHRLRSSVLFLLTQHGLDYLSRQDRKLCFLEALRALKESGQTSSFRRLFKSVPQDLEIQERDLQ